MFSHEIYRTTAFVKMIEIAVNYFY